MHYAAGSCVGLHRVGNLWFKAPCDLVDLRAMCLYTMQAAARAAERKKESHLEKETGEFKR